MRSSMDDDDDRSIVWFRWILLIFLIIVCPHPPKWYLVPALIIGYLLSIFTENESSSTWMRYSNIAAHVLIVVSVLGLTAGACFAGGYSGGPVPFVPQ
jgi:hypothetical protein